MPTTKLMHGMVKNVKTRDPYPLTRPNGDIWACKVTIEPHWYDWLYRAYPIQRSVCYAKDGSQIDCCTIKKGSHVETTVTSNDNSPNRGVIEWMVVLDDPPN